MSLLSRYESIKNNLIAREAERNILMGQYDSKAAEKQDTSLTMQNIDDGMITVQTFSQSIQTEIVQKFEDLLTRGIREIFGRDLKVSIEFEAKGNSYYADFFVILPDGKKVSMAKGEGGGLSDFVSVLQRILYIILEPSHPEKIIFFDENMKFMDSSRAPEAFHFIRGILEELEIQCIWITHQGAVKSLNSEGSVSIVEIGNGDETNAGSRVVKTDG